MSGVMCQVSHFNRLVFKEVGLREALNIKFLANVDYRVYQGRWGVFEFQPASQLKSLEICLLGETLRKSL